jgi:hypothetical protein
VPELSGLGGLAALTELDLSWLGLVSGSFILKQNIQNERLKTRTPGIAVLPEDNIDGLAALTNLDLSDNHSQNQGPS